MVTSSTIKTIVGDLMNTAVHTYPNDRIKY